MLGCVKLTIKRVQWFLKLFHCQEGQRLTVTVREKRISCSKIFSRSLHRVRNKKEGEKILADQMCYSSWLGFLYPPFIIPWYLEPYSLVENTDQASPWTLETVTSVFPVGPSPSLLKSQPNVWFSSNGVKKKQRLITICLGVKRVSVLGGDKPAMKTVCLKSWKCSEVNREW